MESYLFEGIVLVDNIGSAGRKVVVPELGEQARPGLNVHGEALDKKVYTI